MLQFLGASELALMQCFLFPKHCITINDSSLTTSLQWTSVAKFQEHRCRNKRKMLNNMVEINGEVKRALLTQIYPDE